MKFSDDETGQDLAEYGLIAAFVAVCALGLAAGIGMSKTFFFVIAGGAGLAALLRRRQNNRSQ